MLHSNYIDLSLDRQADIILNASHYRSIIVWFTVKIQDYEIIDRKIVVMLINNTLIARYVVTFLRFFGFIGFKDTSEKVTFSYISVATGFSSVCITSPIILQGLLIESENPKSKWMPSTTAVVVTYFHYSILILASLSTFMIAGIKYKNMAKMYNCINSVRIALNTKYDDRAVYMFVVSLVFSTVFFVFDYFVSAEIKLNYFWYTPVYVYEYLFLFLLIQITLVANHINQLFILLNKEMQKTISESLEDMHRSSNFLMETSFCEYL